VGTTTGIFEVLSISGICKSRYASVPLTQESGRKRAPDAGFRVRFTLQANPCNPPADRRKPDTPFPTLLSVRVRVMLTSNFHPALPAFDIMMHVGRKGRPPGGDNFLHQRPKGVGHDLQQEETG